MTGVQSSLADLVAFDSVSNRPLETMVRYVSERFERLGLKVEEFRDPRYPGKANIVASAGPNAPGGLALSGHLDVVPTEGQHWTSDPFKLTERDGLLLGRGSADMKGFLAATLHALEHVDLKKLKRQLTLIWTHDEEVGCLGSAALVDALKHDGRALPSECWIGEPTDFQIFRMHPGHVEVRIETQGVAAHSSKPDLGDSALTRMTGVLQALEQIRNELMRETRLTDFLERPYVTINPAIIQGGTAVNIVPDHVSLLVGYRPLPGDAPEAVADRIRERVQPFGASVQVLRVTPAMHTPSGSALERLCARHTHDPTPKAAAFATDGGNLEALGMTSIVFGPGSIDVAHRPDECMAQDALHRAVDVITEIVNDRCGDTR